MKHPHFFIKFAKPFPIKQQAQRGKYYYKETEEMPSKYKLSPSASERFLTCTASLPHNLDFTENKSTLIGNLQHEVALLRLQQLFFNKDNEKEIERLTDSKVPYKSKRDKELFVFWNNDCENTVNNYISYIKSVVNEYNPKEIFLEQRIKMRFYENNINGVVDFAMITQEDELFIIDLKTGRTPVETEDNKQMLMYAYGFIQNHFRDITKMPKSITISICQSLINNTKAIRYSLKQMIDWYIEQSKPMYEINHNLLVFRPSKTTCKFCQYRDKCNERIKAGVI